MRVRHDETDYRAKRPLPLKISAKSPENIDASVGCRPRVAASHVPKNPLFCTSFGLKSPTVKGRIEFDIEVVLMLHREPI